LRAVLDEHAQGFGFGLANEGGKPVASADVRKTADAGEDSVKEVWAFKGGVEGGDGTGAVAADGAVVGVCGEAEGAAIGGGFGFDGWEQFDGEKFGVVGGEGIVFERAVEAIAGIWGEGLDAAWLDEDADGHWHFAPGDEVVKDFWSLVGDTVLVDIKAGGLFGAVSGWNIDPELSRCAWENFTVLERRLEQFAFGDRGQGRVCLGEKLRRKEEEAEEGL